MHSNLRLAQFPKIYINGEKTEVKMFLELLKVMEDETPTYYFGNDF